MNFKEASSYLDSLSFRGVKLGLSNTERLLKALGNPHKKYKVIHVAGTNGKGSTATMISSILKQAKISTGLYVSPHLESFRERILVEEEMVAEESVAQIITEVRETAETLRDITPTYFEFMTAMAFLHFAKSKVKVAVVEVGLGGRFDSTNVVTPEVSVITSIAMDHADRLGNSLKQIAFEKCGIVKDGRKLVACVRDKGVVNVVLGETEKRNAKLFLVKRDFETKRLKVDGYSENFNFKAGDVSFDNIKMLMSGRQQIDNAACAIMAVRLIEDASLRVEEKAIRNGLLNVKCPARFEVVREKPLVILDGAHNPKAASALCATLKERFGEKSVDFVFGAMKDKDFKRMLNNLAPVAKSFMCYSPDVPRAPDVEEFINVQGDKSIPTVGAKSVDDVVAMVEKKGADAVVCVTGSFYTVGEIGTHLRKQVSRAHLPA